MSIEFLVPDMTCQHCVRTITEAVQGVAPKATVRADVATHRVTIEGAQDRTRLAGAIREEGYEVQDA